MSAQHGTRLRIDAWLPMENQTAAEYARVASAVERIKACIQELEGEIISAKDRVTSRREKPR